MPNPRVSNCLSRTLKRKRRKTIKRFLTTKCFVTIKHDSPIKSPQKPPTFQNRTKQASIILSCCTSTNKRPRGEITSIKRAPKWIDIFLNLFLFLFSSTPVHQRLLILFYCTFYECVFSSSMLQKAKKKLLQFKRITIIKNNSKKGGKVFLLE